MTYTELDNYLNAHPTIQFLATIVGFLAGLGIGELILKLIKWLKIKYTS